MSYHLVECIVCFAEVRNDFLELHSKMKHGMTYDELKLQANQNLKEVEQEWNYGYGQVSPHYDRDFINRFPSKIFKAPRKSITDPSYKTRRLVPTQLNKMKEEEL